jgi:protein-S-isoprenylcysteine O-methyltransferase Ste14
LGLHAVGSKNLYCGRDGLVIEGIYRWTRNPQYSTAIPAYLGASHSAAVLAVASLLALRRKIWPRTTHHASA